MIVFSDLDGSFLTSKKEVSALNFRALDELAARGIDFVPCTGRSLFGIPDELLSHPATRFAISANGASVAELAKHAGTDGKAGAGVEPHVIKSFPFSKEKALEIYDIARKYDVTYDVFADGMCYLRRDLWERLGEFVDDPHILRSMVESRTPVDEQAPETIARVQMLERVSMYWHDPADRDAILAELRGVDNINIMRSYPMNIEVMENGASKGEALAWLCGHLGIDVAEAVAFGDNINDISMIEIAGCGVALGNAEPETKAAADAVCATNDEDGAGRFILEKLGLA